MLAEWDEIALSRILFRVFGLFPSPGANHIGEYIGWAQEMLGSSSLQYFFDPARENPWKEGKAPTFLYNLDTHPTERRMYPKAPIPTIYPNHGPEDPDEICGSGSLPSRSLKEWYVGSHTSWERLIFEIPATWYPG